MIRVDTASILITILLIDKVLEWKQKGIDPYNQIQPIVTLIHSIKDNNIAILEENYETTLKVLIDSIKNL